MKKFLYFIFALTFIACGGDDDEESDTLTNKSIDVSDFTMYKGNPGQAIEITFNNLKKSSVMRSYFGSVYNPAFCDSIRLQFNGNKLTYAYNLNPRDQQYSTGNKIVSDYVFNNDSLYIIKSDKTLEFVALGSLNRLYRMQNIARYPNSKGRDTVHIVDEVLTLTKVLNLAGFSKIEDMTNPNDTIAWCNIKYYIE